MRTSPRTRCSVTSANVTCRKGAGPRGVLQGDPQEPRPPPPVFTPMPRPLLTLLGLLALPVFAETPDRPVDKTAPAT